MQNYPYLGFGLGLRPKHYSAILELQPAVDWFEIISEDYFRRPRNVMAHKELL